MKHQYVERGNNTVVTEKLFGDMFINFLYSTARERLQTCFKMFTSARFSSFLGYVNFDLPFKRGVMNKSFLQKYGFTTEECLDNYNSFKTPRDIFERKIRYWQYRPMPEGVNQIVSPADAKVVVGSFRENSSIFLKEKFFNLEELLGPHTSKWYNYFHDGDFAVFRLTPDKYHYNHLPVTGMVIDFYEISGRYHSCNPHAVVEMVTPYSKNKRIVTILDTDITGGSQIGIVAMVEVVALMIGDIRQCYSEEKYDAPQEVLPGMVLKKGQPKSLYHPGSSTDILLFQHNKVSFAKDILRNMRRSDVESRFSIGFHKPLAETDVQVRSLIAQKL